MGVKGWGGYLAAATQISVFGLEKQNSTEDFSTPQEDRKWVTGESQAGKQLQLGAGEYQAACQLGGGKTPGLGAERHRAAAPAPAE